MLDRAATGVERLLQLANMLGIRDLSESRQFIADLRRETTFLPVTMLGRDVEKERIIGWLKRPSDGRLSSFGIVGGGWTREDRPCAICISRDVWVKSF